MSTKVSHIAVVEAVEAGWVSVAMEVDSACGSCSARHICGTGEERERRITIRTEQAAQFGVGERVRVSVERSMGLRAIAVAYMLPLLLMLSALLVLLGRGVSEMAAGLAALGVAALYYMGVWLLRERISREITFTLHKETEN